MGEMEPGAARPPLSARALAARILERVIDEGAWSQKAIDGELRHFHGDRRDAALATLLVYGVLTWRDLIDDALTRRLRSGLSSMPPRARHHFRVAAYQLGWLSARIPASAAVNEAVNLIRRETNAGLSGVANAVLRGLAPARHSRRSRPVIQWSISRDESPFRAGSQPSSWINCRQTVVMRSVNAGTIRPLFICGCAMEMCTPP